MAKPKQGQLVAIPTKKNNTPNGPEVDLPGEDSWVIVKKQRITILIPPLPVNKQSTMPNPGPSQLQPRPRKTINTQTQCPVETCSRMPSVDERRKSMSLAPQKGISTARKIPSCQPISTFAKVARLDHRVQSENPNQVDSHRCRSTLGVCSVSKATKRSISFLDQGLLLSQRMRASNLEKKLQRAGGVSSWLASLGLDQFVQIFPGKSVNKFQLVNLTMKKLKELGADAVGPRRKLMHAIDCVCQPYCFEAL
uniref:SAM domain-containing protein n=1 Tax=Davidia involucrata TaxID=16924 RepID=A0A5B7A475_DAVIN